MELAQVMEGVEEIDWDAELPIYEGQGLQQDPNIGYVHKKFDRCTPRDRVEVDIIINITM